MKNGPSHLDLIFAPDGIARFEDAWSRRAVVDGFPVCHPDGIITSKTAANRDTHASYALDPADFIKVANQAGQRHAVLNRKRGDPDAAFRG